MKFRAHKPNYMTGFEEPDHTFNTAGELLEAPQIKRFMDMPHFYRLSVDFNPGGNQIIIAEMDGGKRWWVCGYVYEGAIDWLPEWKPAHGDAT